MLETNGVDLVLSGHSHSYERSYLLNGHYGNSNSFDSNIHTVGATGSGDGQQSGNGVYSKETSGPLAGEGAVYITTGSSGKISSGSLDHEAMFYSVSQLGSCILEVNNNQLDVKFLRETNVVDDFFTITKGPSCIVGDPCDDDNPNTENDAVQTDCTCIGQQIFDCPDLMANIGDSCDDGNALTENDSIQSDCNCAGEMIDCVIDYSFNNLICDDQNTPFDPSDDVFFVDIQAFGINFNRLC